MDFKDPKDSLKNNNPAPENKKMGSKLWQSARKCSEVIQKKLKKSHSNNDHHQSTNRKEHEKSSPAPPPIPPHRLAQVTQVTRRGHRPLSAIVTKSSRNTVIDTLEDDSDDEQEAT